MYRMMRNQGSEINLAFIRYLHIRYLLGSSLTLDFELRIDYNKGKRKILDYSLSLLYNIIINPNEIQKEEQIMKVYGGYVDGYHRGSRAIIPITMAADNMEAAQAELRKQLVGWSSFEINLTEVSDEAYYADDRYPRTRR